MTNRDLVRCKGFDVAADDHGVLTMRGVFEAPGWGQGFGYCIDGSFIMGFLAVFRAEKLQDVNGRHCFIVHTDEKIQRVEPLLEDEGEPFDVAAWSESLQGMRARGIK